MWITTMEPCCEQAVDNKRTSEWTICLKKPIPKLCQDRSHTCSYKKPHLSYFYQQHIDLYQLSTGIHYYQLLDIKEVINRTWNHRNDVTLHVALPGYTA